MTMVIFITILSPYFSATNDHISVEGNATNWTKIKAIIIELVSRPKFKAKVDASAITVWTPSIYRKKAIKNINAFLYFETDLRVSIKLLKESLITYSDVITTLSL